MNTGEKGHSIALWILFLCSSQILAQAKYDIKKVNDRVYIFTEIWDAISNGNMGVVIGDKQVLLINSMMLSSAPDLEKQVRKITDLPIGFVINSDSDTYNHNANKYFADKGATIISHENMKYADAFHQVLFSQKISMQLGDEMVTAYHTPSHSLDHIDIFLEKSNVLFMGDGFQPHWLTYTGPNGIDGVLSGIAKAIELTDDETILVPGNTSKDREYYFGKKVHLLRNRNIYTAFAKRVAQLHNKGLDADAIAMDRDLNEIVKELEAYPIFKPFLKHVIQESLEVNLNAQTNLASPKTGVMKIAQKH